ncbi:MAG TPA: aspartate aminotransferase family protein [Chloroflexota bacterium]|jgi:glutamate-1-semialdehyde 2,1-aminomutase|nr:aspartate aminotransferase family protein [Chloroflexota bacterium]
MAAVTPPATPLTAEFARHFARSAERFARAARVFPAGVTHDSRHTAPFPIYVERAQGARKWTIEGHELIDYWMGHGALLLGHNAPAVVEAVQAQLARGTHYGASHDLELEWAEAVCRLHPSVERVRFTSSGTEATLMALRLARAFTGRTKVIKFQGHFHGWHDYLAYGVTPPFDAPNSAGIPRETLSTVLVAPPNDLEAVRALLDQHVDVAAVIVEGGGGSNNLVPNDPAFLRALEALLHERGVVFILDEVISGFRYAPGGAQERWGLRPDLTTWAKILAGGLPGGAVGGRADIMEYLGYRDGDPHWNRHGRIGHQGTFNANPLSAAAGVACLREVRTGQPTALAEERAVALRAGLTDVLRRRGVPGWIEGTASVFHIILGAPGVHPHGPIADRFRQTRGPLAAALRQAMLLEGVDLMHTGALVSAAHTPADIARTVEAFDRALGRLEHAGLLPAR